MLSTRVCSPWYVLGMVMVLAVLCPGGVWAAGQPNDSSSLANTLTSLGEPVPIAATLALTFLGNERAERAGRQAIDAILVTGLATSILKRATRAPRPYNPDAEDGFPSGHASLNFAFARAVASEYNGWGAAAYLFAAGVTWSRVRREAHSPTQALAGAALGWYIADRSVHSQGGLLNGLVVEDERRGFTARPTATSAGPGLELWQTSW